MAEVVLVSNNGCGGGGGEKKAEQQQQGQGQVLELLLSALRRSVALPCQMADADDPSVPAWGMDIGWPTDVRHVAHVTFDRLQGFLGLPVEFELEIPCQVPSASASVFGVSPESMQCGYDDKGNSVPKILLLMQERLYSQHGLKAWFRELPEGVLDSLSPEQVLHCNTDAQCVELVKLLPSTQAALLSWVVELMADVVEEEDSNKMNARNIAMVFAPNMTQMSGPLTALMHAVQVMNLLKTLVLKTLREREDDEGTYSTFSSSSSSLCDELDEADCEDHQGDGNDSGIEKFDDDDSSESPNNVDRTEQLKVDSEQFIGSSRRHTSFEFPLPCISNSSDDEDLSLGDIEEGFLTRLEWHEVSTRADEASNFFPSSKEEEAVQLSSTGSCEVNDQTSRMEDAERAEQLRMEIRTTITNEEVKHVREGS